MAILTSKSVFHPVSSRKPVVVLRAQKFLRYKAHAAAVDALLAYRDPETPNLNVARFQWEVAGYAVEQWHALERMLKICPETACELAERLLHNAWWERQQARANRTHQAPAQAQNRAHH